MKSNAIFGLILFVVINGMLWLRYSTYVNPTVATPAPVDASSPTSCVIGDEVVMGGMAVLDDPCLSTYFGEFGIEINEVRYPFARIPAIDPREIVECRITHYGPPSFTENDTTARCISIRECLAMVTRYSIEWGIPISGFCAVSSSMPWYGDVRNDVPTLIHVQDHGLYLVLDRKGGGDCQGVDLYLVDQDGFEFSEIRYVWEINIPVP